MDPIPDVRAFAAPDGVFLLTPGDLLQEDGPPITMLLNLRGGRMTAGAQVQLWDDRQNNHNHWRLQPYYDATHFTIQSVASGLFLCVPSGSAELGVRPSLHQLPAGGDESFLWQVQQYPDLDTYAIVNMASRTCLNVAGGRIEYGNKVHMWDNPHYGDSQWSFEGVLVQTTDLLDF